MKFLWTKVCLLVLLNLSLGGSLSLEKAKTKIQKVFEDDPSSYGLLEWLTLLENSVDIFACLPTMKEGSCYKSKPCMLNNVNVNGEMLPFVLKICTNPRKIMIDFLSDPISSDPGVPFYRYYHHKIVDHFYTTNWKELGNGKDGWSYEGIQCNIYSSLEPGTVPLFRYWRSGSDHFYTTNLKEIGTSTHGQVGNYGYRSEGVAGYCYPDDRAGVEPLYRFYNERHNDHFYTTTLSEGQGLKYEGIACYVPK